MLLLKNGHVLDPCNQVNQIADVLVDGGKIVKVGQVNERADNTVDASGCYVTPGLIDHHCHLYPLAKIGLPAEAVCFASGVTTAVDAGSTGCAIVENGAVKDCALRARERGVVFEAADAKRPSVRVFPSHTALNFLEIHPVFPRKFALSGWEIPHPSGIFGYEYRF